MSQCVVKIAQGWITIEGGSSMGDISQKSLIGHKYHWRAKLTLLVVEAVSSSQELNHHHHCSFKVFSQSQPFI
jgi:hypothetical protein